jgi:hypothetical protein
LLSVFDLTVAFAFGSSVVFAFACVAATVAREFCARFSVGVFVFGFS